MSASEPGQTMFDLSPTPLLRAVEGTVRQVCRLTVTDVPHATGAVVRIRRPDGQFDLPLNLAAGTGGYDILLPEVTVPCLGHVEVTDGDWQWSAEVPFAPVRRWRVFLVNHSHTDLGFTHPLSAVVDIHNKNLEQALTFGEATADWPDEARFRWTCESAWQVQNFLAANPHQRQRLVAAAAAGTIEIEALYIHSYFDLLSREQLVHALAYAQRLRDELAVPISSAMISDVPGCPWSLVDILQASDVRYLSMAPNNFIAPFLKFTTLPRPFVWQGPAGERVLVWYTDDPYWAYIEGARYGFWTSLAEVEAKLPAKLARLERDGYPFDALQIQTGSDNRPLRLLPATIVRDWNQKYLSPRLEMATISTFFRHAEQHWADRMPVVRGEWQSSWSQTTLHYPHEASASYRNHDRLEQWERLATIADWLNEAYRFPCAELESTYDASLLFDEHSGPKGIWRPRSEEEAATALREGYALFEQATLPAKNGVASALAAVGSALKGSDVHQVVVWNLLDWPRGGGADIALPAGWVDPEPLLIDEVTGQPAVLTTIGERADGRVTCRVQCNDVPAFGFKRFRLSSGDARARTERLTAPAVKVREHRAIVENERLRIVVSETGALTSVVMKDRDTELVDPTDWPGLNALVRYLPDRHGPEPGGEFTAQTGLYEGVPVAGRVIRSETVEPVALRPIRRDDTAGVHADVSLDGVYRWETDVVLHDTWIQLTNRLRLTRRPSDPEVLYVLFPFVSRMNQVRHAAQFTVVDPRRESLPGSSLDSFAIQRWVDLSAEDYGVTLYSRDLPLVDYGGINFQRFLRELDLPNPSIAFRAALGPALSPGDVSPFGREECLEIHFAIRPYEGPCDPLAAHRFAEDQAIPLVATALPARNAGEWGQTSAGLLDLHSSSVVVTGLKRAARADGYVVRLWEAAGRRSIAHLSFPQHTLLAAWQQTPVEGEERRCNLTDRGVRVELSPFQVMTFRCVLGR